MTLSLKRLANKIKKNYSKNAILYLISISFFYISMGAFSMLQGIYIKEAGFSEGFLGNVLSLRTISMALFSIPCAMLVGKIGKKKGILITMFFVPLMTIFQGVFKDKNLILLFSAIQGMANSFLVVSEGPFFMENSTEKNRLKLFSRSFAVNVFSNMLGSITFGHIPPVLNKLLKADLESLRISIIISGVFGLIACIFILFIKDKNEFKLENRGEFIKNFITLSKKKYTSRFIIYNALIGFGAGMVVPYFNVYLKFKVNATINQIGIILGLAQVATGIGGLITPYMAKRMGRIKTINLCQIISIPFLMLIALPPNIIIVSAALFIRNALMNMAGPVVSALTMEIIDKEERSIFASINNISNNLFRAISTFLGGLIMANLPYGYEIPYFITAVLYLAATILFYKSFNGYDKKRAVQKTPCQM